MANRVFFSVFDRGVALTDWWLVSQLCLRISVGVLFTGTFLVIFLPLFRRLDYENQRTSFLLRMLPSDVVNGSTCIKGFISQRAAVPVPLAERVKLLVKRSVAHDLGLDRKAPGASL